MWTDIKGWDQPTAENADRVKLFQRDEYAYGTICLPYRYFQSDTKEELPLVVFLHGADVVGVDNERQLSMHDVGTIFADPDWQTKHPCHILAPQYTPMFHWASPVMTKCLQSFVEEMAEKMNADRRRIYIYGYSAGAIGIYSLLKKYPDYYAAAIPICGSTKKEDVEKLAGTPLWMFHAVDDTIVPSGRMNMAFGSREQLGSHILAETLRKIDGAEVHYTEYAEGEMMGRYHLHPHCCWVLMGKEERVKEWLFFKRRK